MVRTWAMDHPLRSYIKILIPTELSNACSSLSDVRLARPNQSVPQYCRHPLSIGRTMRDCESQGRAWAEPGRGSQAEEAAVTVSPCLMPEQAAPEQATVMVALSAISPVMT